MNGDAHAKNFSVRQGVDGEWRVSPAYDTPSSYPYGDTTMALSIGGRSGGDFSATDFSSLSATGSAYRREPPTASSPTSPTVPTPG
ncbi:HipA domain-containing protein [Micromonospora sp. NBC_01813]|uniref:HipA domain-containing protein n=1 Tax=Micromonospora sp. NBC_01813 TaxID=2975988 RepID=UPI002DD816F1|nr:HipA domain-containing protein [Micromonospora sp. NBC_01813]WSA06661.1 HipA domain-containing protein [Micromonospora sp. NBC_01813]